MSNLLDLVDSFIGNVLDGNVYDDQNQYLDVARFNSPLPPPSQGRIGADFNSAHRLGNIYDGGNLTLASARGGPFAVSSYGTLKGFDVFAIAHWMRGIGKEFGVFPSQDNNIENKVHRSSESIAKGIRWNTSQFLLASLNGADPQAYGVGNMTWNPLSLAASAIPGLRVSSPVSNITVGGVLSDYKTNAAAAVATQTERLLLLRNGVYAETSPAHRLSQLKSPVPSPGFFGDIAKAGETDTLEKELFDLSPNTTTIAGQVDGGGLTMLASKLGLHTNIYTSENKYGPYGMRAPLQELQKSATAGNDKLSNLFSPRTGPGGNITDFGSAAYSFVSKIGLNSYNDLIDAPGINAAVTDAAFNATDEENGYMTELLSENQNYMPFMFQDLRINPSRYLYFRAFLKEGLSETFIPEWQTERYYGRVDQVPTYTGTTRVIDVSFDVVAWSPKDLAVIYKKLQILQSMVYPMFTPDGFLQAGPIVRMRIGDLFASNNRLGIPGYMTALDFSYDDGIWNIEDGKRVPRKISVTLSYTVIHDGNPGLYPYSSKIINSDGNVDPASGDSELTFGAGKFVAAGEGKTNVTVSDGDIRRIFSQIRNGR